MPKKKKTPTAKVEDKKDKGDVVSLSEFLEEMKFHATDGKKVNDIITDKDDAVFFFQSVACILNKSEDELPVNLFVRLFELFPKYPELMNLILENAG